MAAAALALVSLCAPPAAGADTHSTDSPPTAPGAPAGTQTIPGAPSLQTAPGAPWATPTAPGWLSSEAVDEQAWRVPVAPGVDLLAVRRLDGGGWLDLFALLVDLSEPGVQLDALTPPALTSRQPVSQLAREAGAVGAVNGDFFYSGATGAPVGLVVQGSRIVKGPGPEGRPSLAIVATSSGLRATVGTWQLQARALTETGAIPLTGWNEPGPRPGDIVVYDERWGSAPLPLGRYDASEVAHVRLKSLDGGSDRWVAVAAGRGSPPPPGPAERVLLGWRQGARQLEQALSMGQELVMEAYLRPSGALPPGRVVASVSGGSWLVRQGAPVASDGAPGAPTVPHPRAAAGVDATGTRVLLVVADGRRPESRGLTAEELAGWMVRLGAYEALNLDGGGSATLVAALGGPEPQVINRPSGILERPVPVAIGVFYRPPDGSGRADAAGTFVLRPAHGLRPPALDRYEFPFAGLLTAAGVPARVEAVPAADPRRLLWSVDPPDLGLIVAPGQFVGLRPGDGRIVAVRLPDGPESWQSAVTAPGPQGSVERAARSAPARVAPVAALPVRVIGPPRALVVEPAILEASPGEPVALQAMVVDERGRTAPLAPGLVAWWLEGDVEGSVAGGVFQGWPGHSGAPARVQARYLDLRASIPIAWKLQPSAVSPPQGAEDPAVPAGSAPTGGSGLQATARLAPSHAGPAAGAAGPAPAGWTAGPPPAAAPDGAIRVAVWGDSGEPALPRALSGWVRENGVQLLILLTPGTMEQTGFGVPVMAARVSGPSASGPGVFMRRFGSPMAVATRGNTRFVSIDPAMWDPGFSPWQWLAAQLRRAVDERLARLVVVAGQDPHAWPSRREGQMLQAWLARSAAAGPEVWVIFPGEREEVSAWLEEGVTYVALPTRAANGLHQGLVLDLASDRLLAYVHPLAVPQASEEPEAYAGTPQAPIPTHSSPSS